MLCIPDLILLLWRYILGVGNNYLFYTFFFALLPDSEVIG